MAYRLVWPATFKRLSIPVLHKEANNQVEIIKFNQPSSTESSHSMVTASLRIDKKGAVRMLSGC